MPLPRKTLLAAAAVATFATAALMQPTTVGAQSSGAAAVAERQKLFKAIKGNMDPLIAIARGKADADKATMVKHSKNLSVYARKVDDAFDINTAGSSHDSDARDSIWSNRADFKAKASALVSASDKLVAASNSGSKSSMMSALRGVGAACKDCHDTYRDK